MSEHSPVEIAHGCAPATPVSSFARQRTMVARNVLRLIEAKRMSFAEASRLTGISKTGLYKIADGDSDPCLSSLCKIADAFGVPLVSLLEPTPVLVREHLAAKLRAAQIHGSVLAYHTDAAADGIEALCNACEDYDQRLTNQRELMYGERESADAQLSGAIADNDALRAAIDKARERLHHGRNEGGLIEHPQFAPYCPRCILDRAVSAHPSHRGHQTDATPAPSSAADSAHPMCVCGHDAPYVMDTSTLHPGD